MDRSSITRDGLYGFQNLKSLTKPLNLHRVYLPPSAPHVFDKALQYTTKLVLFGLINVAINVIFCGMSRTF